MLNSVFEKKKGFIFPKENRTRSVRVKMPNRNNLPNVYISIAILEHFCLEKSPSNFVKNVAEEY